MAGANKRTTVCLTTVAVVFIVVIIILCVIPRPCRKGEACYDEVFVAFVLRMSLIKDVAISVIAVGIDANITVSAVTVVISLAVFAFD